MYEKRLAEQQGPEGQCGRRLVLVPHRGGRPRLVADHTHDEPCTKITRAGTAERAVPFYHPHLTAAEPQRGVLLAGSHRLVSSGSRRGTWWIGNEDPLERSLTHPTTSRTHTITHSERSRRHTFRAPPPSHLK